VGWGQEAEINLQTRVKVSESFAIELFHILGYDSVGDAELVHDIYSDKTLDLCCCDGCQRLGLSPFCEVVYGNNCKAHLPIPFGHGPDQVEPPLCK
ncbi:unnamed protein product, partial [Prunus brigantina]